MPNSVGIHCQIDVSYPLCPNCAVLKGQFMISGFMNTKPRLKAVLTLPVMGIEVREMWNHVGGMGSSALNSECLEKNSQGILFKKFLYLRATSSLEKLRGLVVKQVSVLFSVKNVIDIHLGQEL